MKSLPGTGESRPVIGGGREQGYLLSIEAMWRNVVHRQRFHGLPMVEEFGLHRLAWSIR